MGPARGYRRRIARLPRSLLPPAGVYHVTSRGVARCDIFIDDDDRSFWVALLRRIARSFHWRCPAWCAMDNHFHILVSTRLDSLSSGMHRLNGVYAQRFNERHARVGHLFQDRFHARVLRDDEHYGVACEYVWNNPVRSGLCLEAHHWPWSGRI